MLTRALSLLLLLLLLLFDLLLEARTGSTVSANGIGLMFCLDRVAAVGSSLDYLKQETRVG